MEKGVPIRSLSRGIAVLQAINRGGTISMMEIARTSNVPYPTACRLVQTLVQNRLATPDMIGVNEGATMAIVIFSLYLTVGSWPWWAAPLASGSWRYQRVDG